MFIIIGDECVAVGLFIELFLFDLRSLRSRSLLEDVHMPRTCCQGPMAADDDEVGRRGTRAQIQGKGKRKQEIKCRVLHSVPPNLPLLPLYTEE
jgi:hypothetical protein